MLYTGRKPSQKGGAFIVQPLGTDQEIIQGVTQLFAWMCRYPHPSHGEEALAQALEERLRARGLSPVRDGWNNLMVPIPAAPGRQGAPLVILQGHLDMVCAVAPGNGWCPETSPVVPVVENGVLRSDGRSSLGADNNLGNAAVLYLLERGVPHGPLRLLLTTAEEVGLQGAQQVDPAWLSGACCLLNTDGFTLGQAVISSAGGLRETFTRSLDLCPRRKQCAFQLTLEGFTGGHSGHDIHRGRANPIRLAAACLSALAGQVDYELLSLTGGHAHNAIPMGCAAVVAVSQEDVPALERAAAQLSQDIARSHAESDPGGRVTLRPAPHPPAQAWSAPCRNAVLGALCTLRLGVYAWRDEAAEQVSASANLGRAETAGTRFSAACFIRAACPADEGALARQHRDAFLQAGFQVSCTGYPSWPEVPANPLADTMDGVWQNLTGRRLVRTAVHVGLEPSVLGAKAPGLFMVSAGPDIRSPHSVEEYAPLEGLPLYVRLLAGTLDELSRA